MIDNAPQVMVALSGGVDSAVAAMLLMRAGYRVSALHMTNWDDADEYCSAGQDLADARRVADDLDIPLHHVNFAQEYREQVFAGFLADCRAGRTPNPDVTCNRVIKFGLFAEHASRLGAGLIATGHYARLQRAGSVTRLLTARDRDKDQTYFLHGVDGCAFARVLFPLGDLLKTEVRRLAREARLANHARRDSTGICFVGKRPFRNFLAQYLAPEPGDIVTEDGSVIGRHDGLPFYTIGQRQGLGIGGVGGSASQAWYVAARDPLRNTLLVVQGHEHPRLFSRGLVARDCHWVNGRPESLVAGQPFPCQMRIRYRAPIVPGEVRWAEDGTLRVAFRDPQWAVTPGQYVAFYLGEECIGGAVIDVPLAAASGHPVLARAPA